MTEKTENQEDLDFNEEMDTIDDNEMFAPNFDKEEENTDWVDSLLTDEAKSKNEEEEDEEEEENEEEEESDDNSLEFSEEEEDEKKNEEEGDDDLDLVAFNKKMNTDFKSDQELRDHLATKEFESEEAKDIQKVKNADMAIDYYSPLLELNDKDLMKTHFEALAIQNKQDINDEDVKDQIEDSVQDLIDTYDLSLKASQLRDKLKGFVADAKKEKNEVESKVTQREADKVKAFSDNLQNAFVTINRNKQFFGVKTDKKRIEKAYKYAKSDKFIKQFESNEELRAQVAMLLEMKEEIHKKASGLTYSDGLKAALETYESSKDAKDMVKAQSRGSAGSSRNSKSLIEGFIS